MPLNNSPVLDISDIPLVGLDSMNQVHREEVELINKLGVFLEQAMQGSVDEQAITEKLADWIDHTREHFAGENQLMQNSGFPAMLVHAGEHQQVLAQIEALQQQWLSNKNVQALSDFIFNDWPQWFDNHVNTMDMVTAHYLTHVISGS